MNGGRDVFFFGCLFFLNVLLNNWKISSIYHRYFRMTSSFYSAQLEHNSVPRQMYEALTSSEKDIQYMRMVLWLTQ